MTNLTVSVAEILGRPGQYRDFRVRGPLEGVKTALARLTASPVTADLRAESVVEGVLVTGRVTGTADVQCARCLASFATEIDVEVCELFVGPGHEPAEGGVQRSRRGDSSADGLRAPQEEFYELSGTEMDLEPMLRDALALNLPLNPVCRAECKGICSRCGADLNQGECGCSQDDIDPRWAALSAIRDKLEG